MEAYKIIASGSSGNCVVVFNKILIDIGVPFSKIKDIYKDIQLITWGHKHTDHYNESTIKKIIFEKPSVRVAVCQHEYERALICGARNIDILEHGKWYNYGDFQIATFKTYHDVESNGWRIKNKDIKILHATDTQHLEGISAKGYDIYALEANYDEETIYDIIKEKEMRGEFSHERGSINSHLSEQQAVDFFISNKKETSQLIRLHE